MIGYYAGGGNIANIDLDGVEISADGMDRVGGIIGRAEDVLALDSISLRTTENIVGDDSVGGLVGQVGHRDGSAATGQFTTRSVSINAADITGTGAVGGLAGRVIANRNSRIYDVAVEADDIRATGTVASVRFSTVVPASSVLGGLVGEAVLAGGDMSFVSVRADSITGTSGHVGGLVGIGHLIPLISSSFVRVGEIRGANYVGGLAGSPLLQVPLAATVRSSLVVADRIQGSNGVGGFWGRHYESADYTSSMALIGSMQGASNIGGFLGEGDGGSSPAATDSLAIVGNISASGSNIGALFGATATRNTTFSYHNVSAYLDKDPTLTAGEDKTLDELRQDSSFTSGSIYADWGDAWCNPADGTFTTDASNALAVDANRIWDLGDATQLPAITCFGDRFTLAEQRGDRDGDGIPDSIDPIPDSDPAVVAAFLAGGGRDDGDGYIGTEDPMPATTTGDLAMGDPDGDRRFGSEDNCPTHPNMNQSNNDGDTYGDACDDLYSPSSSVGAAATSIQLTATAPTNNSHTDILISWTNPSLPAGFSIGTIRLSVNPVDNTGSAYVSSREKIINVSPSTTGYNPTLGANSGNILVTGLEPETDYSAFAQLSAINFRRDDGTLQAANTIASGTEPKTPFTTSSPDTDGDGFGDNADTCPNIPNPGAAQTADKDSDGAADACDVDDYGGISNGLIDINTAGEFNAIRNNLAGTNLTLTAGGTGSSNGCPVGGCNGYELTADLDLAAGGYTNWAPIGPCSFRPDFPATCTSSQVFTGIFDGNGHTISKISTTNIVRAIGNGLFGVLQDAQIRNLNLDDVTITTSSAATFLPSSTVPTGVFGNYIGSLAGVAINTSITNIDASKVEITVANNFDRTGGLIGYFVGGSSLTDSSVSAGTIRGGDITGGLVGSATTSSISSSSVTADSIMSNSGVTGGVVGRYGNGGLSLNLVSVEAGSISANSDHVGGLVGYHIVFAGATEADSITSSFARVGSISGRNNVGGLAGTLGATRTAPVTPQRSITSSVAEIGNITGADNVGGLVGSSRYDISSSMAIVGNIISSGASSTVGGLVGDIPAARSTAPAQVRNRIISIDNSLALVSLLNGMNAALIGDGSDRSTTTNSYHNVTHFPTLATADTTYAKTQVELQRGPIPASASDMLYAGWADAWCHATTGEFVAQATSPGADYVRVWDAGTTNDFPAIGCFGTVYDAAAQNAAVERVVVNNPPPILNADGDAFVDVLDFCPMTWSLANGDADGDGTGDACDDTLGGAAGRLSNLRVLPTSIPNFGTFNSNRFQAPAGFKTESSQSSLSTNPSTVYMYQLTASSTPSSRTRTGVEFYHSTVALPGGSGGRFIRNSNVPGASGGLWEISIILRFAYDRGDGTVQASIGEEARSTNFYTKP